MNFIQAARVFTSNYRLSIDSRDAYTLLLCQKTAGKCQDISFQNNLISFIPPKTVLEIHADSSLGEVYLLNFNGALLSSESLMQVPAFVSDPALDIVNYFSAAFTLLENMLSTSPSVPFTKSVLESLSLCLQRNILENKDASCISSHSHILVEQAREIIHREYANAVTLQSVAKELFINPCYLSTIFHQDTQTTFRSYLRQTRLHHVKKLLKETNHLVTDIAMQTGFNSTAYLISIFRQEFGMTPSAYRAQYRNKHT